MTDQNQVHLRNLLYLGIIASVSVLPAIWDAENDEWLSVMNFVIELSLDLFFPPCFKRVASAGM